MVDQGGRLRNLQAIARKCTGQYFYAHAIPFNNAKSPYLTNMCKGINDLPPGTFGIPSPHSLGSTMIKFEKADLQKRVNFVVKGFKKNGCTISSDGWTDGAGRLIVNVMAISDGTPVFLDSIARGKKKKDSKFIAEFVGKGIEYVGSENVV